MSCCKQKHSTAKCISVIIFEFGSVFCNLRVDGVCKAENESRLGRDISFRTQAEDLCFQTIQIDHLQQLTVVNRTRWLMEWKIGNAATASVVDEHSLPSRSRSCSDQITG
jgi:hypothetical protein